MKIPLIRLDVSLPVPKASREGDAGADLYARESAMLSPGTWALVPTGIAVAIPDGHVGLVAPRSGLAVRHGLSVLNGPGVVDAGYRGEVKVVLVNHGPEPVSVDRGERIAQLVVVPVPSWQFEEVGVLPDTVRGDGGFGSTGRI